MFVVVVFARYFCTYKPIWLVGSKVRTCVSSGLSSSSGSLSSGGVSYTNVCLSLGDSRVGHPKVCACLSDGCI